MLRILSTALLFPATSPLVVQQGRETWTVSFGQENKQHPMHKLFWLKPNRIKGDPAPDSSVRVMQPAHATESQNKILAQQHSLSIRKKPLVSSVAHPGSAVQSKALLANEHMNTSAAVQPAHEVDSEAKMLDEQHSFSILNIHMIPKVNTAARPASAFQSKALMANQHMKSGGREISSALLIILVAGIVVLMITLVLLLKTNKDQDYSYRSGLSGSDSSSEVPTTDSASTDRELKDRMERFERRLDEHRETMMRAGPDGARASLDGNESIDSQEVTGSRHLSSTRPSWMQEKK